MNVSLYQAASALNANARWQEVISQNMASSSIPGYKKQDLSFSAVQAGFLTPTVSASRATAQPVSLPAARTTLNFSPGEIKSTGGETDVAIEGPAFFEVQLANGGTGYTRDGEFKLNAQGELVTKQGFLVMGQGGAIQLDRNKPGPITIGSDGTISQGSEARGKINLVAFNDPNLLTSGGGGIYLSKDPRLQTVGETKSTLRQGCVEGANTTPVIEMANMINVMRSYEANQRVIQMQDERMGRAISELGSPS